jgi:hypothetical protein
MYKATSEEYRNACERILRFYIVNGKMPAYGAVPEGKEHFTEAQYKDAIVRVQKYIDTQKKFPDYVRFGEETPIPTPIPVPTPTPPQPLELFCPTEVLSLGSHDNCVRYLQQKLQDFGFYKYAVDLDFGPETEKSVKRFQEATGHTPDGVVGPKTWSSVTTYVVAKPGKLEGDQWVFDTINNKYGTVNTDQGFHDVVVNNGSYLYYYDQQQSQTTTVNSFAANCADWVNDVGLPFYRAIGIQCRGIHCQVLCSNGIWYGHYIIELYEEGSGVYRDPAGWASHQRGIDELICTGGFTRLHSEGNYIP